MVLGFWCQSFVVVMLVSPPSDVFHISLPVSVWSHLSVVFSLCHLFIHSVSCFTLNLFCPWCLSLCPPFLVYLVGLHFSFVACSLFHSYQILNCLSLVSLCFVCGLDYHRMCFYEHATCQICNSSRLVNTTDMPIQPYSTKCPGTRHNQIPGSRTFLKGDRSQISWSLKPSSDYHPCTSNFCTLSCHYWTTQHRRRNRLSICTHQSAFH